MTDSKKWKSKLLSSGFPLEFDVAKILVSKHFSVSADYTYSRKDERDKDFSVDIHALGFTPFSNPNKVDVEVNLLVECKYRDPNTKWLFLPEPNKADLSSVVLGYAFRVFEEFSPWQLFKEDHLSEFSRKFSYAYKATEIKMGDNPSVYDAEIKHGVAQLQYALPSLIARCIYMTGLAPGEDNRPFIICPILVTTAKLFIAKKSFSVQSLVNSNDLTEFSKEVPYLVLVTDYGPEFEEHGKRVLGEYANLEEEEGVIELEEIRKHTPYFNIRKPSKLGQELADGVRSRYLEYFSHFFICNYDHFSSFIDQIKGAISRATRGVKNLDYE